MNEWLDGHGHYVVTRVLKWSTLNILIVPYPAWRSAPRISYICSRRCASQLTVTSPQESSEFFVKSFAFSRASLTTRVCRTFASVRQFGVRSVNSTHIYTRIRYFNFSEYTKFHKTYVQSFDSIIYKIIYFEII